VVNGRKLRSIRAGFPLLSPLTGCYPDVPLVDRSQFGAARPSMVSAAATVEADPIFGRIVNHGLAVGIVDDGHVDVVHFTVIEEVPAVPVSACVAGTEVTEAVVNSAIETDVRSPVAGMPNVNALGPAPVTGRP
jgi:hypothetical protein